MSRLLICGFGPFPAAPDNPAGDAVARLRLEGWAPKGSSAAYTLLSTVWTEAPEQVLAAAIDSRCDGVLLVGVAVGAAAFRVETLARNHADSAKLDARGEAWAQAVIDPTGPDAIEATAPVQAMHEAVAAAGLPVALSSDAGDYLCNFTFYRTLGARRPCGFLHTPSLSDAVSLDHVVRGVRAAAEAFAAQLG